MDNYICINGKKTALTMEQIKDLGFHVSSPLTDLMNDVHAGKRPFVPGKVIGDFDRKFKIIGYDHDVNAEYPAAHTVTLMCLDVPKNRMHDGSCPGGWEDSELRKWLNCEYIKTLPIGLQELICPTIRKSNDGEGRYHTTNDRLFLPTESELFGSAIYSACECGSRYSVFHTSKDRVVTNKNGYGDCWWTSSATADDGHTTRFVHVSSQGTVLNSYPSNAFRVPFCFQLS